MKKTTLQYLKFTTGLNTRDMAARVGVNETALAMQLKRNETAKHTIRYMRELGVKEVIGIENNVEVKIELIKLKK
jgi:hypothetical protein